jgi:hypothetical protein
MRSFSLLLGVLLGPISCTDPVTVATIPPCVFTVAPSSVDLSPGERTSIKATPVGCEPQRVIHWSSTSPEVVAFVATQDTVARLIGLSPGRATVVATHGPPSDNVVAAAQVNVRAAR